MTSKHRRGSQIEPLEVRLLLSAAVRTVVPDIHSASISGLTYIDSNHDGYHGSDEAGVGGLTIYLDSNRNGQLDPGETSVMTDDSGAYSFTGLRAGTYYVAELPDQDFGQTAPAGEQKVKLKARHATTQVNFANQPLTDDALFPGETFEQNGGEGTIPQQQTTDAGPGDPIGADVTLPVSAGTWTSIGPGPISNGQTPGSNPVSGRIVSIAPDPTNSNIIYLAAASGGVWKTTDGGNSWTPLTDNQVTTVMGSIAVTPSDPNTIYAGTGEPNGSIDSFYGQGILKSTDGGSTWSLITDNNTFFRKAIGKIVVSPTDPNTVFAMVGGGGANGLGGNFGIYKSTDGGATWSNTTTSITTGIGYSDLAMNPQNPNVLYCALSSSNSSVADNVLYETTDGGATWNPTATFPAAADPIGRLTIGLAPSSPQTIYVSAADRNTSGVLGVYKTTDGGGSWSTITPGPNYMGGQGWYDQTVAVNPNDPNTVYVAGAADSTNAVMQSTDGGATWTGIATGVAGNNGPHADHHAAAFDAAGNFLDGNDGGIWKLDNATVGSIHWTDLTANIQVTQFVGIAVAANDATNVFGGSQDNGTSQSNASSTVWTQRLGGDGGQVVFSPNNPQRMYHDAPVGSFGNANFFQRSDDGGSSWNGKVNGISTTDGRDFYPPFVIDPNSYGGFDRLLLGTNRVYESTNNGELWTPISTPNTSGWTTSNSIDAIGVAPSDVNTIYAAAGGQTFVTTNRGVSWTRINTPTADHIAQIVVDPTNSQIAYAVRDRFGGISKVFRTTNGGLSWSSIGGNLPDLPTYTVALEPNGPGSSDDILYVGNDNGVYMSTNLGGSWTKLGSGLPNDQVRELALNQQDVLVAGTYGRGVWETLVGPAASNVVAQQDGAEVHVSWAANSGGANFDVQRSTDGGSFSDQGTVPSTQTTLTDATVQRGHTYQYQIIAVGQGAAAAGLSNSVAIQQTGNVNFTQGFTNNNSLSLNETSISGGQLTLTDGNNSESRNAFLTTGSGPIGNFYTQFDFQFTNPGADGMTFTLQSVAPNTGGKSGGSLGYGGINNSVSIFFNMYSNVSQTGIFTDGSTTATRFSISGNPFHVLNPSGQTDVFHVTLSYNASTQLLSETLVDTGNNNTFSNQYSVNLSSVLQDQSAYVGFTAGTGGLNATQKVLDWWWSPTGDQPNVVINGTPGADNIVLQLAPDGKHINANVNGTTTSIAAVSNGNLIVHGLGSSDNITIDQSAGALLEGNNTIDDSGGSVNLTVLAASGNATIGFDTTGSAGTGSNTLELSNISHVTYTDPGGNDTINLTGSIPATINLPSGNSTVTNSDSAPVFVAAGTGKTTINATSGTTIIPANSGTGIQQLAFAAINISAGAKVVFATSSATLGDYSHHANRNVAVIDAGGLNIATGGILDMGDNDLILHYLSANETATRNLVSGLLASGFDGGAFDTPGINSSEASFDANFGSGTRALGWMDNNDIGATTFDGVNVSDLNEVMVKFTYYGDSDLSGTVDATDFGQFAAGKSGGGTGWAFGNYDYNATTADGADFGIFAAGLSGYKQFGAL